MRAAALALLLVPTLALAEGPSSRYDAPLSFGARLGGLVAYSAPGSSPTAVGLGGYGMFDLNSLLADVGGDAFFGSGATQITGGLGVYFPLLKGANTTPYLGGGAHLCWSKLGGDGAFGLQLNGAVGLLASRQWSPHVRIEFAWFVNTFGEPEKGDGPKHTANGPMLTLGLGF